MHTLRLTAVALCAAALTHLPARLFAQTIQVSKENRTIAVTATDKVIAHADVATVHIGFLAYGQDSDAAYANGSRVSNAIHKALTANGIPEDAIESENQTVGPVQPYETEKLTPEQKTQHQFRLTQSWTVRSNAADAAKVLDLAVKSGANQSGQIDWSLKDENAPQSEAAAKALQRARSVAEEMARSLNAKLGALIYASNEVQSEPIRPLMRPLAMGGLATLKAEPLAINPRQIEKSATVHAIFAIE